MLPFLVYQRWLDMFILPFLEQVDGGSKTAMKEVKIESKKIGYEG
jgi:hypothetical protein